MMSDHDRRPDADTCRKPGCGRTGRDRDGCNCIREQFNDIVRNALAGGRPAMCECKCNGGEPHADRLCDRHATVLVAMHRVGFCDEPPAFGGVVEPGNVDVDGNLTALMCYRCADHAFAVARRKVAELLACGKSPHCPTCGRGITVAADIIERRAL